MTIEKQIESYGRTGIIEYEYNEKENEFLFEGLKIIQKNIDDILFKYWKENFLNSFL